MPALNENEHKEISGCNYCSSANIHKAGLTEGGKQRYRCTECRRRSTGTKTLTTKPYSVSEEPNREMDIEDLIEFRIKKYAVKKERGVYDSCIDVSINIDGPIGICHFGDPHVDDDGTEWAEDENGTWWYRQEGEGEWGEWTE